MQNIDELRDIIYRRETAIDSREETITKMHTLLDKKEKEKRRMQEEIDDLRRQVHGNTRKINNLVGIHSSTGFAIGARAERA